MEVKFKVIKGKFSMKLFDFQLILSLAVSSTVVFLNISNSWASKEAMLPTLNILLVYNIVDLVIGFQQYIKHDKVMFLHHLCTICITCIICIKCIIFM